ncbi:MULTISPECIES: hypothetical protein [unclassified Streptomyces]|uniref:hypothetical protein n=1 Tax=unclassified Streptomyces TaxID=2593676 RepID=UPI00362C61AA
MTLHAAEFFAELRLPFHDATVVGDTYLAAPTPGTHLRLRIDFTRTIYESTYDGLRLAVVHPDHGQIDTVDLSFLDHGTFRRRDAASKKSFHARTHGTFQTRYNNGQHPWDGAEFARLRDAIEKYTTVWFPGARTAPEPSRAAGRNTHTAPAPPTGHGGARTR